MDTTRHPACRCSRPPRTAALAVVVAVAVMAAACSSSDSDSSSDTNRGSAPRAIAETVEVGGGRSIYLECKGAGSPTIVLQSGYGNAGDIWSLTDTTSPAVFPALAETNRVCTYDRPGSMITTTRAGGNPDPRRDAPAGAAATRHPCPATPPTW